MRRGLLDRATPVAQIGMSEWHGCVVHDPDTVILEVKPGPYRPSEFAAWAPEEGHALAAHFLQWASFAKVGETWTP